MTDAAPEHTPTTATPAEAVRLALIAYQLQAAREQARIKAPLSSIALNTMQDAVESMLLVTASKIGAVTTEKIDFVPLLDAVASASEDAVAVRSYRGRLTTLNKARVSFKHHGNRADDSTVQQHLASATEFCELLAGQAFGTSLDDVSMLAFVQDSEVRSTLEEAVAAYKAGNAAIAVANLAMGFQTLLSGFEESKSDGYGPSPYSTKPPGYRSSRGPDMMRLLEKVESWLERIDQNMRVLSIGIDAHEYAFFRSHTPEVHRFVDGRVGASFSQSAPVVSDDAFARMLKFVIDTSLHLASIDYETPVPASRGVMNWVELTKEET